MGDLFNSNEFIAFRQGIRLAVRSRSGGLASGVKDQCLQAKIDEINFRERTPERLAVRRLSWTMASMAVSALP